MWDVAWADPNKELVGEHRARKDKQGSEKNKSLSRQSVSTTSSKGSSHSALSRLRAKATRQAAISKEAIAIRRDISDPLIFSTPEKSKDFCRIEMADGLNDPSTDRLLPSACCPPSESNTNNAAVSCVGHSANYIVDMNERSFTETSLTTSSSNSDDVFCPETPGRDQRECLGVVHGRKLPYRRLEQIPIRSTGLQSPISHLFDASRGRPQPSPTRSYAARYVGTNSKKLMHPVPPVRSPLRTLPSKSWESKSIYNTSSWRKPEDWDTHTPSTSPAQSQGVISEVQSISAKDLTLEVKKLARASPAEALTKLKQQYNSSMSVEDHQKLNDEKEKWMLFTLQNLDNDWQRLAQDGILKPSSPDRSTSEDENKNKKNKKKKKKLLAFFEPRFSALYLAASWPNQDVYHLSHHPLSFLNASNIHPIFKPSTTPPCPENALNFDTVYSMMLPALYKEAEMLTVLNSINRCLVPGGVLNLLIIDPIPNIDAIGEKMRAWCVSNLLRNLKAQRRCLNPSGILPDLLFRASLRGPGSIVTKTQFFANTESVARHEMENDEAAKDDGQEKKVRAELRSIAGRMLWKEVWGQFVTSDKWWWEDAECMRECLELGTYWEYHTIQSVKAN